MGFVFWIIVIIGVISFINYKRQQARRAQLMEKYGDEKIVDMIMKKQFWQGQTTEQLLDSLGRPLDVDQKVLKTKIKEIWKYHETGKNRYALKIILENNEVVGWDQK